MQRVGRVVVPLLTLKTLVRPQLTKSICLSQTFLRRNVSITSRVMSYNTLERGCLNDLDYRLFITNAEGQAISPFHDIPLYSNEAKKEFNMVVEIPRWTNSKMEIATCEELNPIKQDVKNSKIRFVKNCFPHHGYIWNYGAFPQTWEDVEHEDAATGTKGDNDPLDVCEIGQKVHARGSVIQVKVLGVICLIDEGETDWKILSIDVTDPLAEKMNDVDDVRKHMPGFLEATTEWFRIYKMPDGKPENTFAFGGEAKNREFAQEVIDGCHKQWQKLVGAEEFNRGGLKCLNCNVAGSPHRVEGKWKEIVEKTAQVGPAKPLEDEVDKWYYVDLTTQSSL